MDREQARQQWWMWAAHQTQDDATRTRMVEAALRVMEAGGSAADAAAAGTAALNAPPPAAPPGPPTGARALVRSATEDRLLLGVGIIGVLAILGVVAVVGISSLRAKPVAVHKPAVVVKQIDTPETRAIRAFIPEAKRFVEAHRGLKYNADVPVTFLTDADFKKRIASSPADQKGVDMATKEWRALSLIPPGLDLGKELTDLATNGIAGYYDSSTKQLVVRGVAPTTDNRVTLVHELTHALQDQHFALSRLSRVKTDEESVAFRSLVEGDAVRIQEEYIASLPKAEQDTYNSAQQAGQSASGGAPDALLEEFGFPYSSGTDFVKTLVDARGQAYLDAAFVNPPTTTAQIIHPERYINIEAAQPVAAPAADGKVFDDGTMGELGIRAVLYQAVTQKLISLNDFLFATDGWAGDSYTAWSTATGACVRDSIASRSLTDAEGLWLGLTKVAGLRKGWTVTTSRGLIVNFTACG